MIDGKCPNVHGLRPGGTVYADTASLYDYHI